MQGGITGASKGVGNATKRQGRKHSLELRRPWRGSGAGKKNRWIFGASCVIMEEMEGGVIYG